MAIIGVTYFNVAKYDESTKTYSDKLSIPGLKKIDLKINSNSVSDDADNIEYLTDKSFKDGTLSVDLSDLEAKDEAYLLGHTYDTEKKQVTKSADDVAPTVGCGCVIRRKVRGGAVKWKGLFMTNVTFGYPGTTAETGGSGGIKFQNKSIEGSVGVNDDKVYEYDADFDTETDAKGWVDTMCGKTTGGPEKQ